MVQDLVSLPGACLAGASVADAEQVLRALGARVVALGAARPSFPDAVVARERTFPTGLPTQVPVALPHAEAEHVIGGGLAVATLTEPVAFGVMGAPDQRVLVAVVVMLLVPDPHAQVDALTRLIEVVQRPGWDVPLRAAQSDAHLVEAMNSLLSHGRASD